MKYTIEVNGDDRDAVADGIIGLAELIRAGADQVVATLNEGDVIVSLKVDEYLYEHGDYRDKNGNLVHVHEDTVVHATYAGSADQENGLDIPVHEWMEKHGPLTEAE